MRAMHLHQTIFSLFYLLYINFYDNMKLKNLSSSICQFFLRRDIEARVRLTTNPLKRYKLPI